MRAGLPRLRSEHRRLSQRQTLTAALGGTSLLNHHYTDDPDTARPADLTEHTKATYTYKPSTHLIETITPARPDAAVFVNGRAATRKDTFWSHTVTVDNTTDTIATALTVDSLLATAGTTGEVLSGSIPAGLLLIPQTPLTPLYDLDGNLTQDGRWTYTWNAENRLTAMETLPAAYKAGAPRERLAFVYDYQGRRVSKSVSTWDSGTGAFVVDVSTLYFYDAWNVIAELTTQGGGSTHKTYLWGTDLSGSLQGAGGVGGLLSIESDSGTYFPSFDGNGNLTLLVDAADGSLAAEYDYGPFGEPVKSAGPKVADFPFRFSTKYTDPETGLLYYGYRYYQPATGRWLNRDPIGEQGGLNLYGFVGNDPVSQWDAWGLFTLSDAVASLRKKGIPPQNRGNYSPIGFPEPPSYSAEQKFDEWLVLERGETGWLDELPPCPRCIDVSKEKPKNPDSKIWKTPGNANPEHAGAVYEMRSKPTPGGHANQCSYDIHGMIMTGIPAAGTADFVAFDGVLGEAIDGFGHTSHDLLPWYLAKDLDRRSDYYSVRPIIVEEE